jgi:hypothetical protein
MSVLEKSYPWTSEIIEALFEKLEERNIKAVYWVFYTFDFKTEEEMKEALRKKGYEVIDGEKEEGRYTNIEAVISFGTQYGCPVLEKVSAKNLLILGFSASSRGFGKATWQSN